LTEWVLEASVKQCASWHKMGKVLFVSVNLSARLLIEDETLTMVERVLKKFELKAEYLILEITETAIMVDPVRAKRMMEQFIKIGVSLSLDDFGTGYTSISQIKNLPVKEIKIDKSFVLNMLKDTGDAMLVKLIIDMAHGMGHLVVAEGIENQEVLDRLKALGCDIAQGYYLGRPMPASQFNDFQLS
jgi:EAL domain-containing protein (putative c-di-GMP-specific phosphodiesterase class I)